MSAYVIFVAILACRRAHAALSPSGHGSKLVVGPSRFGREQAATVLAVFVFLFRALRGWLVIKESTFAAKSCRDRRPAADGQ